MDKIWLHTDKAISLGLIVNELVTNSCKYALKENPDPALSISCLGSERQVYFEFSDNGPGFRLKTGNTSFGLKLIDLMVKNLKAVMTYEHISGSRFKLSFDSHRDVNETQEEILIRSR